MSLLSFPPKSLNRTTLKVAKNTLSFFADISNRKWPHAMELNVLVLGLSNVMLVSRLLLRVHAQHNQGGDREINKDTVKFFFKA